VSASAGSAQPGSGGQDYAAVRRCHVGMRIAHTTVLREKPVETYISRAVLRLKARLPAFEVKSRADWHSHPLRDREKPRSWEAVYGSIVKGDSWRNHGSNIALGTGEVGQQKGLRRELEGIGQTRSAGKQAEQ